MIKKFLFCGLVLMTFAVPIYAFDTSEMNSDSSVSDLKAYNNDFDILALDFVVPNSENVSDALNVVTVYNNRDANNNDIDKVKLWADNGDDIWQGYQKDNLIATADRIDYRRWVFTNLNYEIPAGDLHLYISVETKTEVTTNRKIQFEIDKYSDANSNGLYEYGDRGIFVESGNGGPDDQVLVSGYLYTLEQRGNDILAPKAVVTNLNDGDSIEITDEFIIEGVAKDRMQGSPKFVKISFALTGNDPIWNDANNLTTNFVIWDYTISNVAAGDYDLQTYVSDWDGNTAISDPITVSFTEPIPEPEPEPVDDEEEEPEDEDEDEDADTDKSQKPADVNDGDLVRAAGDYKVYIINGDYRRWIQSAEIFNCYGHFGFAAVKEITKQELESYLESWLIRADGDEKVYEINADGTKHWLNITAEKFTESGRSWEMVYVVNEQERDFYTTGVDVLK